MRSWLTKIGNSVYRVIGEGPNEGSLRYVGESKAPLKNDYGKDSSGLILAIILAAIYFIYTTIYSWAAITATSISIPTQDRVSSEFYWNGIKQRTEEFSQNYMIKNQIASWQQLGLVNDTNSPNGFKCSTGEVEYRIIEKMDIPRFDMWYKTDSFSVVQSVVCITTKFYVNGDVVKTGGKTFELQQYFLVRSQMTAKRDILFIDYKFKPELVQPLYCNYNLEELGNAFGRKL